MKLKELFEMQEKLDTEIMENKFAGCLENKDVLVERLLALQVEVSELANATRCFKYWSGKGAESKERLLDEYADVLHFFLSVGLALGFTSEEVEEAYIKKNIENYRRQEQNY